MAMVPLWVPPSKPPLVAQVRTTLYDEPSAPIELVAVMSQPNCLAANTKLDPGAVLGADERSSRISTPDVVRVGWNGPSHTFTMSKLACEPVPLAPSRPLASPAGSVNVTP